MPPKKLLIADDSLTIQKVIRLALSGAAAASSGASEGYEIQAVSDGNDAIQQISLFRPNVVLIDVSLPGKSAVEVKSSVNQHRDLDDIRFVMMSSAFEKVDEHEIKEAGFHGRLTKPFDPAHLREILTQVLSQVADRPPPPPPSAPFRDEPTLNIQKPPAPPTFKNNESDSDIRRLTESTIRLSGLADLDSPAPPAPPSSPPPLPLEMPPTDIEFGWNVQEPSRKPDTLVLDFANNDAPTAPPLDFPEFPKHESASAPFAAPPEHPQNSDSAQISKTIQQMVHQELEKALKKLAQETLPDVAERVIKEEIRKLLSDGP